jgi:hypothetical protein
VDVLLADRAHGNAPAVTVLDGRSENLCTQKDILAVMPKRAVPKVGEVRFALIKQIVNRQIILWLAAEQLH